MSNPNPTRERFWQPSTATPYVTKVAWGMLIFQSLIVITGALVRLTGSGLGCPTWPTCTTESLTNTPEMGIHGVIEFGNRLLGVGLGLYSLFTLITLWRLRRSRPDLFWMAFALLLVVPIQAVIGGMSVLTGLNPWVVAAHFWPSAICVGLATYFLRRTMDAGGPVTPQGSPQLRFFAWTVFVLCIIVLALGVLVTGAGPHAGDEASARNGLNSLVMARAHAWPVYLMLAATVAGLILARREGLATVQKAFTLLLVTEIAQGMIGYLQYFTGLPIWIVFLHIIGLCAVISATTFVLDSLYVRPELKTVKKEPIYN